MIYIGESIVKRHCYLSFCSVQRGFPEMAPHPGGAITAYFIECKLKKVELIAGAFTIKE